MPPQTQQCIESRIEPGDRCDDLLEQRVGSPLGACTDSAKSLRKLISGSLYDIIYDSSIPEAIRSPGYDVLKLFRISELQLDELFQYWQTKPSPREAVCTWVAENINWTSTFIPRSHPRVLKENESGGLVYVCAALGGLATLLVLCTAAAVFARREKQAVKCSQIDHLSLLLTGSFLIAMGAIVVGLPASNVSCIASIWLINIGYTLEIVPLVVKIAAINRLMSAGRRMKRVVLNRRSLYGAVACIFLVVVFFLALWTVLDKPTKALEYDLTESLTGEGATIVQYQYYCNSHSEVWQYMEVSWKVFFLLCASVVAFQVRHLQESIGESRTLAFLIYSQLVFVVLRLVTLLLTDSLSGSTLDQARSVLFSVDTIATMLIYFIPKVFGGEEKVSDLLSVTALSSSRLFASSRTINASSRNLNVLPAIEALPSSDVFPSEAFPSTDAFEAARSPSSDSFVTCD